METANRDPDLAIFSRRVALLAWAGLWFCGEVQSQTPPVAPAQPASSVQRAVNGTLPDVNVPGPREAANSAVNGTIARRSATGTKTDTSILEMPQSLSIITREQLELQGSSNIDEAVRYTSGTLGGAFGAEPRSDWVLVRGFRPAMFLDGLALPEPTWGGQIRPEPYLLERVEILKGPGSVLYGALPPSGFINSVSKRPSAVSVNEVGFELGSFNKKQLTADLGGKLDADGAVRFRLVAMARNSDTYVDFDKDDRYAIAPSLLINFSPSTSLLISTQLQRAASGAAGGYLPADGTLFKNPNGTIPATRYSGEPGFERYRKESASFGYELSHRLNDAISLRQHLRWMDFSIDNRTVFPFGLQADRRTLSRYVWTPRDDITTFAVDNQAEFAFATGAVRHTLLTGLDYRNARLESRAAFDYDTAPSLDIMNPVYGRPVNTPADSSHTVQRQPNLGVYLQDQARLGRWGATLSVRHDRVKTETVDLIAGTAGAQRDRKSSLRVGLNHVFDNGVAPYAAYSTSFQPIVGTDYFKRPFVPTTARQVEVGVKYRPPDNRMLLTAAIFDLRQKDVPSLDPDPSHGLATVQQGQIRSRGLELEARMRLAASLDVIGAYTYIDAKVLETARPVFHQPRHQVQAWTNYRFPADSMPGLGIGGGVRYVGGSYAYAADDGGRVDTRGYTVFDLQAQYDVGQWRFLATVSNVADKTYVAGCHAAAWCFYGYPRTFSLSGRYLW